MPKNLQKILRYLCLFAFVAVIILSVGQRTDETSLSTQEEGSLTQAKGTFEGKNVFISENLTKAPMKIPFHKAYADSLPQYVRVLNSNTYLYANADTHKALFALCPTYFVKVLSGDLDFYRVELMQDDGVFTRINGYVKMSEVEPIFDMPASPFYPNERVSVVSSSARIFLTPLASSTSLCTATNSQTMGYYGRIIVNSTEWYYVSYGEYLGYVAAVNVSMPNITNHPTPLSSSTYIPDEIPEPPPQTATDPIQTDPIQTTPDPVVEEVETPFDQMQFALILLITIPSVVIVFILFAPNKNKTPSEKAKANNYQPVATTSQKPKEKPRYFDDYI